MSKRSIQILTGLLLIVLYTINPINGTVAEEIFREEFNDENPIGWEFGNLIRNETGIFAENPDPGFHVVNGVLRAPLSQSFSTMVWAMHSSILSYGSWSFDWVVESGIDHLGYDLFAFMFTDTMNNFTPVGFTEAEYLSTCTGYGLVLISSGSTSGFSGFAIPGLTLIKYGLKSSSSGTTTLQTSKFKTDVSGIHHLNITRDLTGEMIVYFDGQAIIRRRDNEYTATETFLIGSYKGDSGFDNLSLNDNIPKPMPITTLESTSSVPIDTSTSYANNFIHVWSILPVFIIIPIIKRRKNNK